MDHFALVILIVLVAVKKQLPEYRCFPQLFSVLQILQLLTSTEVSMAVALPLKASVRTHRGWVWALGVVAQVTVALTSSQSDNGFLRSQVAIRSYISYQYPVSNLSVGQQEVAISRVGR